MKKLAIGLFAGGILLVVAGVILASVFPGILENKVKDEVKLEEGSDTYEKWADITLPVRLAFYAFNVTNPDEVENNHAKPILQEIGPYVYEQKRIKVNITADPDAGVINYTQPITYFFRRDESEGRSEDDLINFINVPFISVVYGMKTLLGQLVPGNPEWLVGQLNNVVRALQPYGESLIRRDTKVGEMIFHGFNVSAYFLALGELAGFLPEEFKGEKFGLYRGKNGTDDGIYSIDSGTQSHENFGKILSWNGETKVDYWFGDSCNMINGSDGSIFPPFVKKDRILYIFNTDLCRTVYLIYKEKTEFMDIPGYKFIVPGMMFASPDINPANECFCAEKYKNSSIGCPSGGLPVETCRSGAPIVMSGPHFLDGDDLYVDGVVGMHPNYHKHQTFLDIEPNSGLVLQVSKRVQINVKLEPVPGLDIFKDLKDMLFPIMWAEESASLDDENAKDIKKRLITPIRIVNASKWSLIGIGCGVIGFSIALFIYQVYRS